MNPIRNEHPLAKKENLVVRELDRELLVYDRTRDTAHCLNQTAALVWKFCDGQTSISAIAQLLEKELNTPVDEDFVWCALEQLGRDRLLVERLTPPAPFGGMNRRAMIRALGVAAVVAVPVVTSIVAPTPAQAVSCLPTGAGCTSGAECCSTVCSGNLCT